MRISQKYLQGLLPSRPGVQIYSAQLLASVQTHPFSVSEHTVGESLFCCVGIVNKPQVRFQAMNPSWQCSILLSHIGQIREQEVESFSFSQEQFTLVCSGELWYRYCRSMIRQGSIVHLQARVIQRPMYVPANGTYVQMSELQVTPQCGCVSLVCHRS